MKHYLVIGAGPVGATIAEQLTGRGDTVTVLTRSGQGVDGVPVTPVGGSATDAAAVSTAAVGAAAIFHCMHGSAYDAAVWEEELFAAESTVLAVAAELGVPVIFPESLYAYGDTGATMTETTPRTATVGKLGIRTRLLQARAAAPATTVSVVASDFYGPRVRTAHAGDRMVPLILAGKRLQLMGSADLPHSFTFIGDLAAAMVTAADRAPELTGGRGGDRVLHAPTAPALTQRELATALATAAGVGRVRVGTMPYALLWAAGVTGPSVRGLREVWYQFAKPFAMASSATERELGLAATPVADGALATVTWWRRNDRPVASTPRSVRV